MNIAIVGAGIAGVTTAYELAADGHQVTVFERRGTVGEEASFAVSGLLGPGCVATRTAHTLAWPISTAELAWAWKWWRAEKTVAHTSHMNRMQQLAAYSQERLREVMANLKQEFDRTEGSLFLLRDEKDRLQTQTSLQTLRGAGVTFREIDAAQAREIEPALNPDTTLAGAVHVPGDEAGNCRQFALLLKSEAQRLGARFEFNTPVNRIERTSKASLFIGDEATPRVFDTLVVCAGVASASLLRPLGLKLALAGVHSYSVSAPVREPLNAPRSAVLDMRHGIAITRLGQRVRVAGGAQIGGTADSKHAAAMQRLYQVLRDWFPGAGLLSNGVQEWSGIRPTLADGPPLIGASGVPGVWLNLGHGAHGWALACGSARALADTMAGRSPEVNLEGLGIERLTS